MYNWAKTQNSLHCFPHANWDAYSRKTVSSLLLSRMFCFEFCTRGHIPAKRRSLMVKQHIFLSVQSLCIHKIVFCRRNQDIDRCVLLQKKQPPPSHRGAPHLYGPQMFLTEVPQGAIQRLTPHFGMVNYYPLVICHIAIEPIEKWWLSIVMYVYRG